MKCRTAIADDDPLLRGWLSSLLERSRSFDLLGQVCTGAECLALVERLGPDAVVLDVDMQDWDGLELAGHMGTLSQGVKTVLISSHSDRIRSMLAQQEGAQAFISKESLSISATLRALEAAPVP